MKKGIFWCDSFGRDSPHLIVVSVKCDADGKSDRPIDFSSKSGQNFNHKAEWQKLSRSVTRGQPFNYYPRGRVEIKNRKATVFLNPIINKECIVSKIIDEFALMSGELIGINIKSDGSDHYRFTCVSI